MQDSSDIVAPIFFASRFDARRPLSAIAGESEFSGNHLILGESKIPINQFRPVRGFEFLYSLRLPMELTRSDIAKSKQVQKAGGVAFLMPYPETVLTMDGPMGPSLLPGNPAAESRDDFC